MEQKYNFGAKRHASAKDSNLKLRLALYGPPGAGKTRTLLETVFALLADKPNARVLVADSENRSACKYADMFPPFDVIDLDDDHSPQCMRALVEYAENEGYDALVLESLSHEWMGKNGVLEQVDAITAKTGKPTDAWRQVTPFHDALFQKILNCKIHFLASFRSKQQVAVEKDERGRTQVRRYGMQPITRDGMEYEFDVTARMEPEGNVLFIEKTRCPALNGKVFRAPKGEVAIELRRWLGLDGSTPQKKEESPTSANSPQGETVTAPREAQSQTAGVASGGQQSGAQRADGGAAQADSANEQQQQQQQGTPSGGDEGDDGSREVLLRELARLIAGDEVHANAVLFSASTPYISEGQTYRDLTTPDIKKVLAHAADFSAAIARRKTRQQKGAGAGAS